MKKHPFDLSRRDVLRLLGIGAGVGLVGDVASHTDLFAQVMNTSKRTVKVPKGAVIRTVLADIDPNTVTGATLMHEHLGTGRPGRGGGPPTTPSQDEPWMAEELIAAKKNAGLQMIVA